MVVQICLSDNFDDSKVDLVTALHNEIVSNGCM